MKKSALLDLLFPPRCAFCAAAGAGVVCPRCAAALPRMGKPLLTGASFGTCAVPLRYEGVARDAILRFKFRGGRGAAAGFGAVLAQCVAEELGGAFELVTWAPVSKRRLRERGYDQSYLLARETARLWEAKPLRLLKSGGTPRRSPVWARRSGAPTSSAHTPPSTKGRFAARAFCSSTISLPPARPSANARAC